MAKPASRPRSAPAAMWGERGDTVLNMASAYWAPRCLHVVAELGVADQLGDAPRSATELAEAVGANGDALNRVLRLLASHGIFEERGAGVYAHNETSRSLRSDHPRSRRAFARFMGGEMSWKTWGALEYCVRTGKPATEKAFPGGMFAYYRDNPEAGRVFDEAMVAKAHGDIAAILPAYDFSTASVIADIGGGRGHLLRAVLEAVPAASGILFDLPHVVQNATAASRITAVPGDFFKDALPEADLYVLMNVLHDWADEPAGAIASAVRSAAPDDARVLIVESVLSDDPGPHLSKLLDIQMLRIGGRERSRVEYAALLARARMRIARVVPTDGPLSIIEAVPV